MDFSEPEHLSLLRASLRRFVDRHIPRSEAGRWDQENHFPRDIYDALVELGVTGLTVPPEYGGAGRDILACMLVIEELSRRSLAVSVPYIMSACYAGMNLLENGSPAQRAEYLPRVVQEGLMFAYGWSEPDVGADLASVRTTVRRDGDMLVVNGHKRFCSGSEICDYIFTLARSGPQEERYRNLSFVLVPPSTPGVEITRIDSMGMKGAATTDVVFTDVRVPEKYLVGEEEGWNRGWHMLTGAGLDVEKLEVAAIGLGVAGAALDDAWEYASMREQFGRPIAEFQAVRHKLADMRTRLHAARLVMQQAAWLADKGERCGVETSMAKLFVTETAKTVVLEAQEILGAYGYVKDFDVERYVRDVLLLPIIGGSSAIQRNNIANWLRLGR